uniref:Tetraspanin n=1 Tax=Salarias fasciatus TaxID=181472 RepID=A0A672JPK1_SALFA
MGKANVWVKRTFIVLVGLIAIIGLLLLGLTLFSHGHFHKDEEIDDIVLGLHFMYALAVISVVLAAIGGFGACKEKKWALIVFVVGMILSSLFLFGIEIVSLALQPQFSIELKAQYLHMMPLSNASEVVIDSLGEVQRELQCCGLDEGYLDWDYNIPDSCLCAENSIHPCVAAPRNSRLFEGRVDDEPIMIYSESCLPYITESVMAVIKTAVGIMMGVTLLLVFSAVLGHHHAVPAEPEGGHPPCGLQPGGEGGELHHSHRDHRGHMIPAVAAKLRKCGES